MTRLAAILLIIFVCGISQPLQAQSDTPPPYLYYYSQLLGGLIIEHPDGTDSRQIAADVIPPNMTGLSGPGWSPSGKYFAASGSIYLSYATYKQQPYLIDLKGQPILSWLSLINSTSIMQWSPTGEDILLIVGNYGINRDLNLGTFFWLIDVEHGGKLLADFGADLSYLTTNLSNITWDAAHQQISFYLAPESRTGSDRQYYRVTMHFNGETSREPVTSDAFIPLADSEPSDAYFDDLLDGNSRSASGNYEVRGYFPSKLTNTHTGKTIDLPLHTAGTVCTSYIWDDDEQYIIKTNGQVVAGGGCGGSAMGVTDINGTIWREIGGCPLAAQNCAGWLPTRVNLDLLPIGAPKPIQLDPVKIEYATQALYIIDPTKAHVLNLLCNQNEYETAIIRDSRTLTALYKLAPYVCPYRPSDTPLPEKGIDVVVAEDPVHHLLATYGDGGVGVTIWTLNDGIYAPILKLNTQGYLLEFTDDGEYLRARNYNGWKIYSVADILAAATKPQE